MNKKSLILATTTIIIIVVGIIGVLAYFERSNQNHAENKSRSTDHVGIDKNRGQNATADQKADTILIHKIGGTYEINLQTKEVKPYAILRDEIIGFAGLPKEIKNKQFSVYMGRIFLSEDTSRAMVIFATFDETAQPSGFDGSLPVITGDEFVCEMATKKCSPTGYLASAYKTVGEPDTWFNYSNVSWYRWDSAKNLLYGHLFGEGIGMASPVYVFNLNDKILKQTVGYDSRNPKERRAEVPSGTFSPSLNKFVMVDENGSNDPTPSAGRWDLLIYDSNNLSAPIKKFDISAMKYKKSDYSFGRMSAVAWSADEKMLVLETEQQIFTSNLESGKISLVYTDTVKDESGVGLDFNAVDLSPSERYIVFVDYDKRGPASKNGALNTVLKAIDLEDNNKVIELLHGETVSLIHDLSF